MLLIPGNPAFKQEGWIAMTCEKERARVELLEEMLEEAIEECHDGIHGACALELPLRQRLAKAKDALKVCERPH